MKRHGRVLVLDLDDAGETRPTDIVREGRIEIYRDPKMYRAAAVRILADKARVRAVVMAFGFTAAGLLAVACTAMPRVG